MDERGRRPLTKRQQALAGLHYPLALSLAERHSRRVAWLQDEILSAAHLGLVKAARRYKRALHVPFWWFARLVIVSEISATIRHQLQRHEHQVDLVEPQLVPVLVEPAAAEMVVLRLEEARLTRKQILQLLAVTSDQYDQARRRIDLPRAMVLAPGERMVGA